MSSKTLGFQTEVKELLQLMIHSLYSNPDIFLRELISNSSDALDKLRFLAVSDASLLENDTELKITISWDAAKHTLTICDNGIGMNYDEVIVNLGTIAKSGTREFIQTLNQKDTKDMSLIGQFGVGFYSAFIVAKEVTVYTRKAGEAATQGVKWHSKGEGEFQIETTERTARGTEIVLSLRKESEQYADAWRLQSIIHQYSDHILFPIFLQQAAEEGKTAEFKQINSSQALWTRAKSELTEKEYQDFYHHISHDYRGALDYLHYHVEGKQQYTALLYIPEHQSQDLFQAERKNGLKLFIQRVFIMDNAGLLPNYLRFIKGVVDSSDLPLNISREILQVNPLSEKIKSGLTKKILQHLSKMAADDAEKYQKFWQQFGVVLKEGLTEDFEHQKEIAELLRFASTHLNQSEATIALKDYVSRMKADQEVIYYIIADQFTTAQNSPHLEIFRERGLEVLLLSDRIDEWMMAYLTEFEGKKFQSVTKGDLNLDTSNTRTPEATPAPEGFDSLLKQMTEALKDRIQAVRLSKRLKDSPACLVSDQEGMSLHLQRLMSESGHAMPASKPYLEINADHALIKQLQSETEDSKLIEWTEFLYDQALLAEGGNLQNPALFVKKMNNLILGGVFSQ